MVFSVKGVVNISLELREWVYGASVLAESILVGCENTIVLKVGNKSVVHYFFEQFANRACRSNRAIADLGVTRFVGF